MGLIDADWLIAEIKRHNDVAETKPTWRTKDVVALLENCPTPPNPPLTLEELRGMDGESVWVEHENGGEWVTVAWNRYGVIAGARQARLDVDYYGCTGPCGWFAYRRKPEEGMT